MRRIIALLVATLALLLSAVPASAVAPERIRLEPAEFTISGSCPFDVHYEELRVSGHALTFFNRNGDFAKAVINGNFVVRLTNVETGESLRLNISGQFLIRDGLGFDAHGRNLLFAPIPEPLLVLSVGNSDVDLSEGLAVSRTRGRLTDVCAILAP